MNRVGHLTVHWLDLFRHEVISTVAWEPVKTNIGAGVWWAAIVGVVSAVLYPPLRKWVEHELNQIHTKLDHIIEHHPQIPNLPKGRKSRTEMTTVESSNRKAGRVGPHKESHRPDLMASTFLTAVIPAGFSIQDVTGGITDWGMDDNDKYGCCGFAARDHLDVAKTLNTSLVGKFGQPKFATLLDAYFAYGVAQGETPPTPDEGVSNAAMMQWDFDNGFNEGFMEISLDTIDFFVGQGRGVIIGVAIDGQQASQDFENHVAWGAFPNAQDGHDVLVVKTDGQGGGTVVTWGGLQDFTPDFRAQIQDAWVVLDAEDTIVDRAALVAAIQAGGGTVNASDVVSAPSTLTSPVTGGDSVTIPSGIVSRVVGDVENVIHDVEHAVVTEVDAIKNDVVGVINGVTRHKLLADLHRVVGMTIENEASNVIMTELQAILKRYA